MAVHPVSTDNDYYDAKWQVDSHSDPNKSYIVSRTRNNEYQCSCPVWIYRRRECKHVQEVQAIVEAAERVGIDIRARHHTPVRIVRRTGNAGEPVRDAEREIATPVSEFRIRRLTRAELLKRELEAERKPL